MNPHIVATRMLKGVKELDDLDAVRSPKQDGLSHLKWMLVGIENAYVMGEQAHRWLGYVQGMLVALGLYTMQDFKAMSAGED